MMYSIGGVKVAILGSVLLLILLHPHPSHAHNGAVAIAVPVEGIVVDGDLSDWPAGMTEYAIALSSPSSDEPEDEEDYRGIFRIGYSASENALYLSVEMRDDSVVLTGDAQWDTQDGCEVYVDAVHALEGNLLTVQLNLYGNNAMIFGPGAAREDFAVAVRRTEDLHQYEWRIDVERMTDGQVRLEPEMSLGVDVALIDRDVDGSWTWMSWGTGGLKSAASARVGDVVLTDTPEVGALRGRLVWEDGTAVSRASMHIRSSQSEALWVMKWTDRQGRYAVELPTGRYHIAPTVLPGPERTIEVDADKMIEVEDLVFPVPRGRELEVNPGRRMVARGRSVPAGEGQRRGVWQSLEVEDGLPDPSVADILQDRDGFLWFATNGGGVCRYDGEVFILFTAADGLVSDKISSILQTDDGNIWFGGRGGISRYDGEALTTFSFEEIDREEHCAALLEDRRGHLWIGTEAGVIRYDGETFVGYAPQDGLVAPGVSAMAEDGQGNIWFGTTEGVSLFNGTIFENYTFIDGLAGWITAIVEDREKNLWFGSYLNGAFRYDGAKFTAFRATDGLRDNRVTAIAEDRHGRMWFGTRFNGVSCYDGKTWKNFTTEDGLAHQSVMSILEDRGGDLWFGTGHWLGEGMSGGEGVSRFGEGESVTLTAADGLPADQVMSLTEDSQGNIWIGTWRGVGRYDGREVEVLEGPGSTWSIVEDGRGQIWFGANNGLFRYDGQQVERFTTEDGFAGNFATRLLEDRLGDLWIGTLRNGASRYDGESFVRFDTTSGLAGNKVLSIAEDRAGDLWFGTDGGASRYDGETFTTYPRLTFPVLQDRDENIWFGLQSGGISRYDGETFADFTTADGLSHNYMGHILEDRQGHLWFSTWGGGINRYDGKVFQNLSKRDGLPHNAIQESIQDREGNIWIATEGGAVRFRPGSSPPPVRITGVVADQEYGPLEEISLPTSQDYLAFEFLGTSYKTRPNQMVYLYQLEGHDAKQLQTRKRQVAYYDLPVGEYVFRVTAVDRDLNHSEKPAEVRVSVHLPYERLALMGGLALALAGFVIASGYGLKRRRDLRRTEQALMRELEEELQTAHDMQMSLMPTESPRIERFEVGGRCLPTNHVGGDLFQYFERDGKLSVCLADVTGHAMEAAVPVMMFAGVLHSQMEEGHSLEKLLGRLNSTLHATLERRTFVCFTLGELDLTTRTLQLANCGCPYPLHYRAATGQVTELQMDAYPLGIRAGSTYATLEIPLESGDRLVLCSDGIVEATNPAGDMFGFERVAEVVRQGCRKDLSAEASIDHLTDAVKAFAGKAPQEDDMTIVVLKMEA